MKSNILSNSEKIDKDVELEKCSECNGTGTIGGCCFEETCRVCEGKGWIDKRADANKIH